MAKKQKAKRPKPEVIYREAEGALLQIASQWKERFLQMEAATPGQEHVPPVLILVCDNTDIAEVFYRNISGETETETLPVAVSIRIRRWEDIFGASRSGRR
jgi:type III restriction enzyme